MHRQWFQRDQALQSHDYEVGDEDLETRMCNSCRPFVRMRWMGCEIGRPSIVGPLSYHETILGRHYGMLNEQVKYGIVTRGSGRVEGVSMVVVAKTYSCLDKRRGRALASRAAESGKQCTNGRQQRTAMTSSSTYSKVRDRNPKVREALGVCLGPFELVCRGFTLSNFEYKIRCCKMPIDTLRQYKS